MNKVEKIEWTQYPPNTYRVMAFVTPEPEGGFSVVGINLPGCCTQGETMAECLDNLKEAAMGLIESYLADGDTIPWITSGPMPERPSAESQRVTVFVTVPPASPAPA